MTATNFPEFNAAVTELTTKVSNLLGDVATMQSVANVQVAVDKAAEASTSATEAASSKAAAASSASSAASSKDSASASATKAGQWAEAGEGEDVETGKYSAKHHAIKAAASASSSAASASTSTTKAGEASTSAANAANSAATATTKAGEAAASANTAGTKAGEAASSAANAANSAATATTKAGEAASSAANASSANTSAQAAKTAAETARDRAETAAATVTGNLIEMGGADLSGGVYPAKPENNGAFWKVTAGGVVGGVDYGVGDTLVYSKSLDQFYKIDNTESVTSVAGRKGVVTLTKTDVGLGNVDNTSDADKPVSTAQQVALDLKVDKVAGKSLSTNDLTAALLSKLNASAPLDSPALTGNPTAPTPAADDADTSIATTAFVRSTMALFGLGADAPDISNLNTLVTTGQYVASSSATGFPPGALSRAFVNVQRSATSTTYVGQTATFPVDYTGGVGMAERFSQDSGATWGAWQSIWHTGNLIKQTSSTDTTAGALMAVGAFGNGRHLDLRDTVFETGTPADVFGRGAVSGFARGGPDGLNIPVITSNSVFGVLSVYGHWTDDTGGAGSAWREFRTSGGRVYHQDQSYGAWGAWREVFNTGNILGTVSQAGGVPTGAIIERGSNANGEYVRFADGTQICSGESSMTTDTAYGSTGLYYTLTPALTTFPANFANTSYRVATAATSVNILPGGAVPVSGSTFRITGMYPANATLIGVYWIAIGRWY